MSDRPEIVNEFERKVRALLARDGKRDCGNGELLYITLVMGPLYFSLVVHTGALYVWRRDTLDYIYGFETGLYGLWNIDEIRECLPLLTGRLILEELAGIE